MKSEITIFVSPSQEKNPNIIEEKIFSELKKSKIDLKNYPKEKIAFKLLKKSLDARHGKQKFVLRYQIFLGEELKSKKIFSSIKKIEGNAKTIGIIGFGPAAIFCAFELLRFGIKPVIFERGAEILERKKDIAKISQRGELNSESNYCFGEGGAGTFSDGKLFTRSKKRGNIEKILKMFFECGASESILTEAHPHIGTEKLPAIIKTMHEKIIALGGEIHFNTRVENFIVTDFQKNVNKNLKTQKFICGLQTFNTILKKSQNFQCDAVVWACGHSALDSYQMISRVNPNAILPKDFAVGVRVEHPRKIIDEIQFKTQKFECSAEYFLSAQIHERGVYSFCMCPGGFIVPSASAKNQIVVNGMSASARNSVWSNAAIVTQIKIEDVPKKFFDLAKNDGCEGFGAFYFRSELEKIAFENGSGTKAPAQRLLDFLARKKSENLLRTSYAPGVVSSRIDLWLPPKIYERLSEAFKIFDQKMKGFICPEAILLAIETRTSSPVKILRGENCECVGIENLFVAGEGAGYSGGIVSSAMDGEKAAKFIAQKMK